MIDPSLIMPAPAFTNIPGAETRLWQQMFHNELLDMGKMEARFVLSRSESRRFIFVYF
ncbi:MULTISPECIES: hypothetical protein [unclassified Novosphingobium]|uniref:hypothetical protein n=1 Tax=unclassified Novosphingobium TaxID=2644732 RepID=UPI00146D6562|nr:MULTISPECIES: hypothetical protein [unclassified Novosphingobium]NMN07190.1 hypothetical protein [Novosphingobium sp. SG919]NMN89222.1 hypothetical protein [Novosphingobium sp. SG916]